MVQFETAGTAAPLDIRIRNALLIPRGKLVMSQILPFTKETYISIDRLSENRNRKCVKMCILLQHICICMYVHYSITVLYKKCKKKIGEEIVINKEGKNSVQKCAPCSNIEQD